MSGMVLEGTFRAPRSGADATEKARKTSAASGCYERGALRIEFERLQASLRAADLCDEHGSPGCWRTRDGTPQGGARDPSIKRFVERVDIATLTVFRASNHARSITG